MRAPFSAGRDGPDPLAAARAGEHTGVVAKLRSGYVTLGDSQYLPGNCTLLSDTDHTEHLTELPRPERAQFQADLGLLGEALMGACAAWDPAFSRLDFEIRGNRWRHLAAHVFPRYSWEPVELRDGPVWGHPADRWSDPRYRLGPRHERLVEAITRELSRVLAEVY